MIKYKDKTFCASPNCKNECGKQMSMLEEKEVDAILEYEGIDVTYEYFCGEPDDSEIKKIVKEILS
jgi:hypothetical protein